MRGFITEILYVVALSRRTQVAIVLGIISFLGISILGEFYVSRLHFSGAIAGLEQAVIPRLMKQYDKAAFIALLSFWSLAFKLYRCDKRRFF